jgi:hypothetical protein
MWPSNAYVLVPLMEDARGGSLILGVDGDGVFEPWPWQNLAELLARRRGPRLSDFRGVARAITPRPVRRFWHERVRPLRLAWLREEAERRFLRAFAAEVAGMPIRWDKRLERLYQHRYLAALTSALDLLANDAGTHLFYPFVDGHFLSALARRGGATGLGDRTSIMRTLFTGLLPHQVLAREDKGDPTRAQWGEEARRFVDQWDGRGIPEELVDAQALRAAWSKRMFGDGWSALVPDARSWGLVQAAWLASDSAHELRD